MNPREVRYPGETDGGEVTVGIRVDDCNPAHVYLSVFVGRRGHGSRALVGQLVMATDEWEELVRQAGLLRRLTVPPDSWTLRTADYGEAIQAFLSKFEVLR